ncbi:MAG TPA: hypothetical protein VF244_11125, partial [Acidimicrobiales bacterium]
MSAAARLGGAAVRGLAVTLAAALWHAAFIFSIGGLSDDRPPDYWFQFLVMSLVLATPWMVAVGLLRRRRRAEGAASSSTMDTPARLLAAATATLPEDRRPWGAAMRAELGQAPDAAARWRFALGCARVAMFPPRSSRGPVVAAVALGVGAAGLTGLTVGQAFPPMQVFATTFVGLVGAAAAVLVARSRPRPRPTAGAPVLVTGTVGVASCIAAAGYLIHQYPTAALHLHAGIAFLFAAILAGALCLVVAPPRCLTGDRWARPVAVGVALVLALGLLSSSRADLRGDAQGVFGYVFFVPIVAIFVTAVGVGAGRRSLWAGVQAAVWTALLASLAFAAIAMAEAGRWYQAGSSLILAGDSVPLDAVGENIRNFTLLLVLLPYFWMPFGVLGAAIGRA